ncbi:MAG: alpha/beta hydrolase [Prolixibacteraceae bacterium]|jgi:acetyl esterase/lipase|nr:alpha/beta hydrolase [Prolixibacteraceae bacterium]
MIVNKYTLVLILSLITVFSVQAQRQPSIKLWPNGAPGANPNGGEEIIRIDPGSGAQVVSNVHEPSITPYIPKAGKATGVSIVIAPGGAHRELWMNHEGYDIAQKLADNGITVFILKYRLARDKNSNYTVEGHSVKDMQRAVRLVRSRASEWKIDPTKIGIMGFSAGGQVAALTDIQADSGNVEADDPVETFSSKPNFQVLVYPAWVNDITLSKSSAPAFIVGGFKDMESISTGMPKLYLKFKEVNVPAELHIYADVGHGFGFSAGTKGPHSKWVEPLIAWMFDINKIGADQISNSIK